ncbi:OmpL47-type beta-barrel domain-containing protein [Arthrobacter sp. KN11-1C]|uniref:OmpL47-type beta-barrel domain-containing protein n=1 Tax=Arthrobacter sp. KN11-1C TaxID=3445774 RepID=UPI003F9FF555
MNKPQHSASRGNRHALRRRATWTLLAVLFISWGGPAANAFWQSLSSSNFGAAKADTMPQGSTPARSLNGTNVTVSWAAVATPGGHAVAGYTVARYSSPSGGTKVPAGGGCAGSVSGLSCIEQSVPDGTWYYAVTPVISLWTGTESGRSAGVAIDTTPPTISVTSISPTPNAAGFNNTSPVTVNLSAVDNPGGSGVANIKYTLDGGSTLTVNAATAAVSVSGEGTHTLSYSATDAAGNSSTPQTQTVKIDTVAPAAPTISVPTYVNIANKSNVQVTGTAEPGTSVTLTVSDAGSAHTVTQTVTTGGSGAWSTSGLNLAALNDGTTSYGAVAKDAADNTGPAATATSVKDTLAPVVSSVALANGGTAKTADAGDTLSIVFSTDMDAHTLCSGWDSTSATHTATGTASISTGEVLTFGSTTCAAPSFGSVALVGGYNTSTTSPLNFTTSTMTWTQSTGTLVITLGVPGTGGGTAGTNVSPKTPVYSPTPGAADKAGNPIGTITSGGASKF